MSYNAAYALVWAIFLAAVVALVVTGHSGHWAWLLVLPALMGPSRKE